MTTSDPTSTSTPTPAPAPIAVNCSANLVTRLQAFSEPVRRGRTATSTKLPTVLIVQRHLTHYRVAFFNALRAELGTHGVNLRLACGQPARSEAKKSDGGLLTWSEHIRSRYFWGAQLCWLPFGQLLNDVDLVVVAHENKLVYNLLPQFFKRSVRFAFWGHGSNMQRDQRSWRERYKRWCAKRADWWFAYSERGRHLVVTAGFPADHITVLNNAPDTQSISEWRGEVTAHAQSALRLSLGLQGQQVGVYLGSLYVEKRIEFLLASALEIRKQVPEFELVVIGAGPKAALVTAFCKQHAWAHAVGAKQGSDMVALVSLARVMLNPGAVGLSLVDSFACRVPLFTTECGLHGPEIDYLVDQQNGVITSNSVVAYAGAVSSALKDPAFLTRLQSGCDEAAGRYTMEKMVSLFAAGVLNCLQAPVRRRSWQV